ncbi:MAG: hypothetical protein KAH24_08920 [Holophagae bacterium]|nr:hypothetical protein [Holophagae bacterium]
MESNNIESDIRYVKGLVEKADCRSFPVSIYYLWSVLVLAGFAMVDFAPEWVGLYWMIAGPGGGILSGVLGSRMGARQGQLDREIGIKHALHWSGMMVVILLAVLLAIKGLIQGQLISQVILLVVALGWWTAGVHFDRRFLWLGGVMMLGFIGTLFFSRYVWTVTGVLMAAVLVGFALFKGKDNA